MADRLASHRVSFFPFGLTMAVDICPQDASRTSHANDHADVEAGTNRYEMGRISSSKLKYMDQAQFLNEVRPFSFRPLIEDVPNAITTRILIACRRLKALRASCSGLMRMSP